MPSRALIALAATVVVLAASVVADARTSVTGTLVFALEGNGARDTSEIVSAQATTGRLTWLTRHPPSGSAPRWTGDGRHIVFWNISRANVADAIWRMSARGTQLTRLPGGCCDDVPSPDARRVAVCTGNRLQVWSTGGRRLRTLARGACAAEPAWSPDGRYVAAAVARDVAAYARTFVFRTEGPPRAWPLTRRHADMEPKLITWAPDSRRLLIAGPSRDALTSNVDVVAFDGRRRERLVRGLGYYPRAAWSADGRAISFVGPNGGIYVLPTSGGVSRRIAATRQRHTSEVYVEWSPRSNAVAFSDRRGISIVPVRGGRVRRLTTRGAQAPFDWSPRGSTIVFSDHNNIYVIDVRSRRVRQLTWWVWDDHPRVAGDGSRIAFVRARRENDLAYVSVYVMRRDGSAARRLGRGHLPRFSRDGRYLVYVDASASPDRADVPEWRAGRIIVADLARRTRSAIGLGTTPTWSPDGERIAFMRHEFKNTVTGTKVTNSVLWTMRRDGSDVRPVLRSNARFDPEWSPDGRTIAARTSVGDLALIDVASGTARIIDTFEHAFAWSPDSRQIAAVTLDGLELFDAETGASRTIIDGDLAGCRSLAWSPDGTQIAYAHCDDEDFLCASEVRVVRSDGTTIRRIALHGGCARDLQWSP